jgi:beta-N-acetylhexosaminidase
MSLRALAARALCVGFPGAASAEVPLDELRALGPGGLVLFARNVTSPEATALVVDAAREASSAALVAIDQEGGRVARLRDGAVELPAMMALGAADDPQLAERAGGQAGRDLRRIGVDVDFAPVCDLAVEPRNTVIGARAFGSDPVRVGALTAAFARGLRGAGVAATAKHFPGHGATEVDSHVALPVVAADLATLRARELVPFRACIASGVEAVMVAHVLVPALDAELPASLSRRAVTGLLREELAFDGAVFTDCIEMDAVAKTYGSARAAVLALAAGVDGVVVSHHLDLAAQIAEEIARAVEDGRLARERLERAVSRLERLRSRGPREVPGADPAVGVEIARRAVKVLRGSVALGSDAVTIVSFEGTSRDGVGDAERADLNQALRRRGVKSEIMRVPLEPEAADLRVLLSVVAALPPRDVVVITRRADLHPPQRAAVDALIAARPQAIVVSAREPYDAGLFESAASLACIYGDQAVSFAGLAERMTERVR